MSHEFAVRYRRRGWESRQVRMFQSEPPARRFVRRILTPDDRWTPMVEVTLERREVGSWIEVTT